MKVKKENLQHGDFIELKGFRSDDIGKVYKKDDKEEVIFKNKVISLVCWDDNLKYIIGDSNYDVIAIKRLSDLERLYSTPQNMYCAKNVADRYEELGLTYEFIKRNTDRKV